MSILRDFNMGLTKLSHLLIAGSTGAGKSMVLHALICRLAATHTPDEIRFALHDPKCVEFGPYAALPHLACPVVRDAADFARVLHCVVEEVDRRMKTRAEASDAAVWKGNTPTLVIVADEISDVLLHAPDTVLVDILHLLETGPAVGVHLVLATLRWRADYWPFLSAHVPARIVGRVPSKTDSREVLGSPGAERLQGRGDLLFCTEGTTSVRMKGALLSDEDIHFIVSSAAQRYSGVRPLFDLIASHSLPSPKSHDSTLPLESDLRRARDLVSRTDRLSISHLQHHLGVGFNRTVEIADILRGRATISESGSRRDT